MEDKIKKPLEKNIPKYWHKEYLEKVHEKRKEWFKLLQKQYDEQKTK